MKSSETLTNFIYKRRHNLFSELENGKITRKPGCLSFSGISGPIFSSRTRIITRPARLRFVKKYKSPAVEGGRKIFFFWMNAQYIYIYTAVCKNFKPPRYINIYWRDLLIW